MTTIDSSKNVTSKIEVTGWYVVRITPGFGNAGFAHFTRGQRIAGEILDGPFAFQRDAKEAAR